MFRSLRPWYHWERSMNLSLSAVPVAAVLAAESGQVFSLRNSFSSSIPLFLGSAHIIGMSLLGLQSNKEREKDNQRGKSVAKMNKETALHYTLRTTARRFNVYSIYCPVSQLIPAIQYVYHIHAKAFHCLFNVWKNIVRLKTKIWFSWHTDRAGTSEETVHPLVVLTVTIHTSTQVATNSSQLWTVTGGCHTSQGAIPMQVWCCGVVSKLRWCSTDRRCGMWPLPTVLCLTQSSPISLWTPATSPKGVMHAKASLGELSHVHPPKLPSSVNGLSLSP